MNWPQSWKAIEHPQKRAELLFALKEMGDVELQRRLWLSDLEASEGAYGLDAIVHMIFDDSYLGDQPTREIGYILLDSAEAGLVRDVSLALSALIEKLGNVHSSYYVTHADWPEVARRARVAFEVLSEKGMPS